MLAVKEIFGLCVILLLVTATFSAPEDVSNSELYERVWPTAYDEKVQFLIDTNKRSISAMKRLVEDLETNFGKRTSCLIDGGLAAACRHRDLLEAMDNHRFLASPFAPGRRRRRSTHNMNQL